ncbi:MAG TPA: hypothetical protein PKJ41_02595 [Bryobacteraceae bacterium]|nr:hypothetical protein [Bryobacteraceae bacterium]HPT26848.1 hypothetical protein [Bryobacteraceae bacterium]
MEGLTRTVTLTVVDVEGLPQQTIKTDDHGKAVVFQGVRLRNVLDKVDLPLGDKFHSTAAGYYMLVEARDGYRVVYAWAEIDSEFLYKAIFVATRRDGRWARQVTALRIRRAG